MKIFGKSLFKEIYCVLCNNTFERCINLKFTRFNLILTPTTSRKGTIYYNFSTSHKYFLSNKDHGLIDMNIPGQDGEQKKKKSHTAPKITLINLDGEKSTMYLEQAEKLAKHKGLKLTQDDNKKSLYKLTTVSSFFNSEVKSNSNKKHKKLILKSNITDHDLQIKINKIIKLLEKGSEIFLQVLKIDNDNKSEEIYQTLEKNIEPNYSIRKEANRGKSMVLKILPVSKAKTDNKENSN